MNNLAQAPEQIQLYDNFGLWHVPFWQERWFIASAVITGIVVSALVIYVLMRLYRLKKKVLTPLEQALHDLQMLKKKGLCTVATGSAFYAGLTGILKNYLSALYRQDVCSNTDQQMVEWVAALPLFDAQKEGLSRVFSAGELIKFAQRDALQEQMQSDWLFCVDFVKSVGKVLTGDMR